MTQKRPLKQKTIGVLGGCSDVATKEYYQFLNSGANKKLGDWDIAETIIVGMNFGNLESFVRSNSWQDLEDYMTEKVRALSLAGADVLICASNTIHKVLENIVEREGIEFIHISDPVGKAIQDRDFKKVAIFGTRPVMEMDYIKKRYKDKFDIEVVSPNEGEQELIDKIIFNELVKGKILDESKKIYLDIAERMQKEEGIEGLILGCTEIFLLIKQEDCPDLPVFNTAKLHCDAAIEYAIKSSV